jgi:hypothetical protein
MSRDYEEYCPECKQYKARLGFLFDDDNSSTYQGQCLNCGYNFVKKITRKYTKLDIEGNTDNIWKKAYKLI